METKAVRQYRRKRVYIPVECKWKGDTYDVRGLMLGGGGLLLGEMPPVPTDTELTLRFCPTPPLPAIEAKAKVKYQLSDQGIGVEFTTIQPEHRRMIMLLVGHCMVEKRIYARAPLRVQVEDEKGRAIGISRDISVGGMFIDTKTPAALESNLKLRFRLEDGGPAVVVVARLRYAVNNFGVGVQFIGLSSVDRTRINVFVTKSEGPRPLALAK